MKKTLSAILGLISQIGMANAATSSESISIFSDICEKINQEDTVSKARLKAIDKGVFNAISKLPVLEIAKKNLGEYDFNILVYNLVDNYVENLNTKTTEQTSDKICVNISGYIKGNNIISAVIEAKNKIDTRAAQQDATQTETVDEFLDYDSAKEDEQKIQKILEEDAASKDDNFADNYGFDEETPPLPQTEFETDFSEKTVANKVIVVEDKAGNKINEPPSFKKAPLPESPYQAPSYETNSSEESDELPLLAGNSNEEGQEIIIQDSDTILIVNNEKEKTEQSFETLKPTKAVEMTPFKKESKAFVYIADTSFYDNSSSKKFSETAKKLFLNNDYFLLTDNKDSADYVVTPKILRSKVDSINAETNRMQMVIMMECRDLFDDTITSKHQNRFTLFSTEDNEQEVAKNLINKLIESASEQTISKIEQTERKRKNIKTLPKIITPAGPVQEMDNLLYL